MNHQYLAELFQAQVHQRRGQWQAASELLARVLPQMLPSAGLRGTRPQLAAKRQQMAARGYLWLAELYERRRMWDLQRDASLRAIDLCPPSLADKRGIETPARFTELRALASLRKHKEAALKLRELKNLIGNLDVQIAGLEQWETKFLAQQETAKPVTEQNWERVEERFLADLAARGDISAATKAAAHVRLLLQQKRYDAAEKRLQSGLTMAPGDVDLQMSGVELMQARDGSDAALGHWQELKAAFEDSARVRLFEAALIASVGADNANEQLLALEQDTADITTEELDQLRRGLGAIHRRMGNLAAARRLWRAAAAADPDDAELRLSLFALARAEGDHERMIALCDEVKRSAGPDSPTWKLLEAHRLHWSARNSQAPEDSLARARQLAREARQTRPNWHPLSLVMADIELAEDNVDAAIENLQLAIEQGPPMPDVVRQLVDLLRSRGRIEEARDAMRNLAATGAANARDQRFLSLAEAAGGNLQGAVELARKAAVASNEAADHLWLAGLLDTVQQQNEALVSYRRAVELEPQNGRAALALLRALLAAGQREQAAGHLQRMTTAMPEPEKPGILGRAYQMSGDKQTARTYFQLAVTARPDDPGALRDLASHYLFTGETEEAKELLHRLMMLPADEDAVARAYVAWARRTQARLLAATGRYADYLAAIKMIQENRPPGGALRAEDLNVLAAIASQRRDLQSLRQAIDFLEQAERERSLMGAEQMALARLYERSGRWSDCERVMTQLAAKARQSENFVVTWCEMKLRRGDTSNVELLLRDLSQPSPRVAQVRARLCAVQGKPERAAEIVRGLIPPSDDANRLDVLLRLAGFLEEINLHIEADRYFRAYARKRPAERLRLAAFLARQGELREALDICQASAAGDTLAAAISTAVNALGANRAKLALDSSLIDRVEGWLQQGLRESPDSKFLHLQRATLAELRGDPDVSASMYRNLLKRNDILPHERGILHNNLAMILALRGQCDEAERIVARALEEFGPVPEVLDTRAVVAICRGDAASLKQATEDLRDCLVLLDTPAIHFHLAWASFERDAHEEARAALKNALDAGLTPDDVHILERDKLELLKSALEL